MILCKKIFVHAHPHPVFRGAISHVALKSLLDSLRNGNDTIFSLRVRNFEFCNISGNPQYDTDQTSASVMPRD